MVKVFAILMVCVFLPWRCAAATNDALSCSYIDVSNAIWSASSGDTVRMPAPVSGVGVDWTNTMIWTKRVGLIGPASTSLWITNNIPNPTDLAPGLIYCTPDSDGSIFFGGFTIVGGATATNDSRGALGELNIVGRNGGTNTYIRISDVWIVTPWNQGIIPYNCIGVIDHCWFLLTANVHGVEPWHSTWGGYTYGNGSWALPPTYGTTNQIVIEDCVFTNNYAHLDAFAGARLTLRRCKFTNGSVEIHGTESSGAYRGARHVEWYDNDFYGIGAADGNSSPFYMRGGSGVIWSNRINGNPYRANGLVNVVDYRGVAKFNPWGGADGTNAWDNPDPVVRASGTHSGGNSSVFLEDSGKSWTINEFRPGFVVQNTNNQTFATVLSNTATRIYFKDADGLAADIVFNTGQGYRVYFITNVIDGVGMGSGDLLGGDVPTNSVLGGVAWPRQTVEGVYVWGNTFDGTNGIVAPPLAGGYALIRKDWHYFDLMEKPGYTPLVYPHPMVSTTTLPPGRARPRGF
jgi:hypothetical protein